MGASSPIRHPFIAACSLALRRLRRTRARMRVVDVNHLPFPVLASPPHRLVAARVDRLAVHHRLNGVLTREDAEVAADPYSLVRESCLGVLERLYLGLEVVLPNIVASDVAHTVLV